MTESADEMIAVDRVRVGMFVHLDLHWTQHPFQFGSFLIKNESQLVQLRTLGLKEVRYTPKRSEVPPLPEGSGPVLAASDGQRVAGSVQPEPSPTGGGLDGTAGTSPGVSSPERLSGPEKLAQRKALLAEQQASLDRCEHQFSEVSRQLRSVLQTAKSNPIQAREAAVSQVGAMVGQVNGIEDVAIRLLSEKAGQETTLHAMNVSVLAILLARAMRFDEAQLGVVGLGALLHDIGKLELPDRLRWRDDNAPAVERRLFQGHAAQGVTLAKKMGLPPEVIAVIGQHHEHADGSGYPNGLKGEQITLAARVVAVVNQYDNLCNPGNPAQALTPHDALALIFARQREAFDASVLAGFIRMMGVYPPGSVLQLNDERYAIVVSVNADRPLKPSIVIHDRDVPADDALVVNLEHHPEIGIQRAVKPLQLPRAVFDYLSPRKRMCYFFERSMAPGGREVDV
jgi:putative nucleotidyltransferase with HDIG domain